MKHYKNEIKRAMRLLSHYWFVNVTEDRILDWWEVEAWELAEETIKNHLGRLPKDEQEIQGIIKLCDKPNILKPDYLMI